MSQLDLPFETGLKPVLQLWTPDDIYDRLDQDVLELFREDRRLELKSARVDARALGEYLSMWSNTHPHGGIIVVGVEDNGALSGCKSIGAAKRIKLEMVSEYCPDARWAVKDVKILNEKGEEDFLTVFRVNYRADKLVETTAGDAFKREGSRKIKLTESLKREVRIAKGEVHYELEPVALNYPADFDKEVLTEFHSAFLRNRRLSEHQSITDVLCLAKMGRLEKGGFQPNLACALLFAKDPREVIPGARIRIIRYEGTSEKFGEEQNSVFSTFVDGCIPRLLTETRRIVETQIRTFQPLQRGRLSPIPEYPESAWFEALVNAVAHRSYNFKTQNIFVKLFDDRFVVESPGGFVPPTTSETVYDSHNPRNPYLMEAMMQFDLTFCGFEGTRRMRQAMTQAGLPEPSFQQREVNGHQIQVTLSNNLERRRMILSASAVGKIAEPNILEGLDPEALQIVGFLLEKDTINVTTAALMIGKSWPTANKILAGLLEKEVIELVNKRTKKHDPNKLYRLR